MRVRAVTVALAVVAAASSGVALWPLVAPGPSTSASIIAATPVLSLRRAPDLLTRTIADGRLSAALGRVMDDPALGAARDHACLSVRDPAGRVVFARNTATPLIPASNLKLLTATAALARLGPAFRYRTVVRPARPVTAGVLSGDLFLVGAGDPLLATADFAAVAGYQHHPRPATPLEALADRIAAAGVRQVQGRVVGDESRYDAQRYVPTWNPSYITDEEVGPMSALTVNGGFVQWVPRAVAAPAPAANAAAMLTNLLRARGVTVAGPPVEGPTPPDAGPALASVDSAPLVDVVGVMLRESDNLTAELLVKELGARFAGAGTTGAGLGVMRDTLAGLGLAGSGLASVDGSGLDRSDRLTCDLLQGALAREGVEGGLGRGLPVAGRDGTLTRRFVGSAAGGRVRAKTGSLKGVVGLSGWATAQDGRFLQFSLIANELPRDAAGVSLEDRVVNALVGYPQAPAPSELAPLAPTSRSPGTHPPGSQQSGIQAPGSRPPGTQPPVTEPPVTEPPGPAPPG